MAETPQPDGARSFLYALAESQRLAAFEHKMVDRSDAPASPAAGPPDAQPQIPAGIPGAIDRLDPSAIADPNPSGDASLILPAAAGEPSWLGVADNDAAAADLGMSSAAAEIVGGAPADSGFAPPGFTDGAADIAFPRWGGDPDGVATAASSITAAAPQTGSPADAGVAGVVAANPASSTAGAAAVASADQIAASSAAGPSQPAAAPVAASGPHLTINLFSDGFSTVPAAAWSALQTVAQFFANEIVTNVTVNFDVGWGEVGGTSFHQSITGGTGGEEFATSAQYFQTNYSTLLAKLNAAQTSADDRTAIANLMSRQDPSGGGVYQVPFAEAKALGLVSASGSEVDAYVGFNPTPSRAQWSYNQWNVPAGQVDFIGVAEHEISHALGRVAGLGAASGGLTPLDLFRWQSPGVGDPFGNGQDYFSFNNGSQLATHPLPIDNWGNQIYQFAPVNEDPGDWSIGQNWVTSGFDSFGYYSFGVPLPVSPTDLRELDVLGYNLASPLAAEERAPTDFLRTGTSDILFQNTSSGDTGYWRMVNGGPTGWVDLGGSNNAYQVAASGDFIGNGTSDPLFQNVTTGDSGYWQMSDGIATGWVDLGGSNPAYRVAATGDFFGNGTSDPLFENTASGDTGYWNMQGGVSAGWVDLGGSNPAYHAVATGDFFGTGTSDVLFQNTTSGDAGYWKMANGAATGWVDLGGNNPAYRAVGAGDFFGNGTADVLFQSVATGDTGYWKMANGVATGWVDLGGNNSSYHVAAIADLVGNGTSDIVFQNISSGDTGYWNMSNGIALGWVDLGGNNSAYHVAGGGVQPANSPFGFSDISASSFAPSADVAAAAATPLPSTGGGAGAFASVPILMPTFDPSGVQS